MKFLNKTKKERSLKISLKAIFTKFIFIYFLCFSSSLFAQHEDIIFNDLGNGNTHKYWEKYTPNQQITSSEILNQFKKSNVLSLGDSLGLISTKTSRNITHHNFQQFHDGTPVEGAYFSFHSINDFLIAFNGTIVSSLSKYNTNAVIESAKAIDLAKEKIGATTYAWEDDAYLALLQSAKEDEHFSNTRFNAL